MISFITVLRAVAACLITNSHYTGIYPTDLIANGGLIGDVIFFAVSGYCLCNLKGSFGKWYLKRIYRIYIPVCLVSILFLLAGFIDLSENSWVHYFVYPTDYHFVASIILLYIPFYFIMSKEWGRNNIPKVMMVLAGVMLFIYIAFYDKSYYHIDKVREPFIRFLFFESMLLGAFFKHKDSEFRGNFSWKWIALALLTFIVYFASKILFSKNEAVAKYQIVNQFAIFALLYCILRLFSGLDKWLSSLPKCVFRVIAFVAKITLEIYIVQYVAIDVLRPIFGFPINWLLITGTIVLSAVVLHYLCRGIYFLLNKSLAEKSEVEV